VTGGCNLRRRPHAAEAINKAVAERLNISRSRVLEEISKLAFSNVADVLSVEKGALILGIPIGLFGVSFHWRKIRWPSAGDWMAKQAGFWWPAAAGLAFIYFAYILPGLLFIRKRYRVHGLVTRSGTPKNLPRVPDIS
jgi:hypothetical protein